MGMKQKNSKKKFKKKIQNGRLKKAEFFNSANSQYFFVKISWISPWVSRIDWCEGHWCGSTFMVVRRSDISSKTGKKCIFGVSRLFLGLCQTASQNIGWATSMPFASINPTNPRTDPWNFHKKILRIDRVEKWPFFESAILIFFFASSPWKLVTNYVLELQYS